MTTNGHGASSTPTAEQRAAIAAQYRDHGRDRLLAAVEEVALEKLDGPDADRLLERAAGMTDDELIEKIVTLEVGEQDERLRR
jgi:hypothetical protein